MDHSLKSLTPILLLNGYMQREQMFILAKQFPVTYTVLTIYKIWIKNIWFAYHQ